jgi:predicted transcriptional regulator
MADDPPATLLDVLEAIEGEQPVDETLAVLSDRYARYVLYYLAEHASASLDELAEVVAGWEATDRDTITTTDEYGRIRMRLYHVVLPKLDAVDYVDFDTSDVTVRRADVPSFVSSVLGTEE